MLTFLSSLRLTVVNRSKGAGHASAVKTGDSRLGSPLVGRSGEARLSSSSRARPLAGIVRAVAPQHVAFIPSEPCI